MGILEILTILALVGGAVIFWVWALVDCIRNEPPEGYERLVWVVVIVAGHLVGAIVYAIVRRPKRIASLGR